MQGHPGRLAAGSCDARDETVEWVARGNDNGYGGGCFLGRPQALIASNEQQVHIEADELAREFRQAIKIAFRPPGFDDDVLSLDISQFTETLPESVIPRGRWREISEPAEARQLRRLLRVGSERHPSKAKSDGES
jgi:hypothetical protein